MLLYHEGRNVRFLIKAGSADSDRYRKLTPLAKNKFEAWRQMQPIRFAPESRGDVGVAIALIERDFELSLEDLAELFANEGWKNSKTGGNKWLAVTQALRAACEIATAGDEQVLERALSKIGAMPHNTSGTVAEKLKRLDDRVNILIPDPLTR